MVVAVGRLAISLPGVRSLKEKRSIVRRTVDRTANRFNAAVAEVADQDDHRRAVIGFAVVSNDRRHATRMMDEVLQHAESVGACPVLQRTTEIINIADKLGAEDRLPAWLREHDDFEGPSDA